MLQLSGAAVVVIALQNHFTKAGIVGYGVNAQSKESAEGDQKDITHYTDGKVKIAFFDDTLPFAGDVTADVARMKSRAGCRSSRRISTTTRWSSSRTR